MKARIICKNSKRGVHSFYLLYGKEELFLFEQHYRKGVQRYYGESKTLDAAFDSKRAHSDHAILRTMEKLFTQVKRIEKQNGFAVLEQTKRQLAYR